MASASEASTLKLQPPISPAKPAVGAGASPATPPQTEAGGGSMDELLAGVRAAFAAAPDGDDAKLRSAVSDALAAVEVSLGAGSSWARYVHFGETTYSRNLVAFEGRFSIILNCWKPGQCTPEHDHRSAGGSTAWMKMVKGSLVLTQLSGHTPDNFSPRQVAANSTFHAGMVSCASAEEIGLHKLSNNDDEVAISLHVYSPPMLSCCGNPVVLCQRREECITEKEKIQMHVKAPTSRLLFTNFRSMVQTLHHEIEPLDPGSHHSPAHIAQITTLLSSMRFNRAEFSRYLNFRDDHYTRNLVGYDVPQGGSRAKFTALILCWDKGQMSPIHDHAGSSCWVKVLQGQLREVKYEYRKGDDTSGKKLGVLSDRTFEPESVAYINDTQGVHAMGNPNADSVTVSLHVYAPPYVLCKMFDPENGSTQVGSMAAAIMPSNPFTDESAAQAAEKSNTASGGDDAPPTKRLKTDGPAATPGGRGLTDSSPLSLSQLQIALKQAVRPDGSCEGAAGLLQRLVLAQHEWQEFVHFEPFRYTRSLVALDSSFSLMALCWNKGHATPLHSHAPGVSSWAKVLRGSLTLKRYDGSVAAPTLRSEHSFVEGDCLDEQEYSGLHIVGNPSSEDTTVSLHLYSPPYVDMASMCPVTGRQVSIPVVHSATSACGLANCEGCTQPTGEDVDAAVGVGTEATEAKLQMGCFGSIYTDFHGFVNFMRSELNPDDVESTTAMLEGFKFHPSEWREYASPPSPTASRGGAAAAAAGVVVSLVAQGDNAADRLELCSWEPGAEGPAGAEGGRCWLKVLAGELEETEYGAAREGYEPVVVRRSRLSEDSVTYYDGGHVTGGPTRKLRHPNNPGSRTIFALRLVAGPSMMMPGRC